VYYYLGLAYFRGGKYENAIKNYTESLRLNPEFADAHKELGLAFVRSGDFDGAIKHYTEALRLKPDWVETMNNLAWILATAEEARFRDSEKAVELAERACELTKYQQPILLDTLAAAYAAGDRFDEAIETAEKAIKLAEGSDQKEFSDEIQSRLQLYKAGQYYIEKLPTQDSIKP
jgi:tetratricopeptide (TPR) repeat protein